MRYVLTACPLINCRSLVNNLANPTRGYRPGELHKPCAVRVSLPEGGGFLPTDSILRVAGGPDRVDRGQLWPGRGNPPISPGLRCERQRARPSEGLSEAGAAPSFPPFVHLAAGARFVARSSCFVCAAWVHCSAVLHVPYQSLCSRRFVEVGSWVPIRTQASDRACSMIVRCRAAFAFAVARGCRACWCCMDRRGLRPLP